MNQDAGTIVVTGAAGDIGKAIVRRLNRDGFHVIGSDVRDRPTETAQARWVSCDLAIQDGRAALLNAVKMPLRGFVHAAGLILSQSIDEITDQNWDLSQAINVKAALFLARGFQPLLQNGASIVFVGSVAGQRASPENLVYASTKAALRSVAASMAVALAQKGIRVNVVAPGLIDTETTKQSTSTLSRLRSVSLDDVWRARVSGIPQSRPGSVDEVANCVSWLISDQSSYVTGSTLAVNGGLLAGS